VGKSVVSCIVHEVIQILVVFAMISGGGKPANKLTGLGSETRLAYGEVRRLLVEQLTEFGWVKGW